MTLHQHSAIPDVVGSFVLSDPDFKSLAELARDWYGLSLPLSKKQLVYGRLSKRLRALKFTDFKSYLQALQKDEYGTERQAFLSALTTNVTHFFREAHHFELLEQRILSPLIDAAKAGAKVRIWSAGCSSGQEPYSIALTVLKLCPQANRHDIKILATDIDPVILHNARAAIYPTEELTGIPPDLQSNPQRIGRIDENRFRIGGDVRSLVAFAELNLIEDWPMRGKFDVIICRNVAIYFDQPTQSRLWERFSGILNHDGHLIIGHSERLSGPSTSQFVSVGVTAYAKTTIVQAGSVPGNGSNPPKGDIE